MFMFNFTEDGFLGGGGGGFIIEATALGDATGDIVGVVTLQQLKSIIISLYFFIRLYIIGYIFRYIPIKHIIKIEYTY
jgi:hypothetical protein